MLKNGYLSKKEKIKELMENFIPLKILNLTQILRRLKKK